MENRHIHTWWVQNWDSPGWQTAWAQLISDVPQIIEKSGVELAGPSGDPSVENPIMVDFEKSIAFKGAHGVTNDTFYFLPEWPSSYNPVGLPFDAMYTINTAGLPYDAVVTCILLRAWEIGQDDFDVGSRAGYARWRPGCELYKSIWSNYPIELMWGVTEDIGQESGERI
ncbi:hypothetical protein MYU51_010801 [Penicillium brevicompactum]|uniref:uncharacterized protein n=1 Tax=Penicillium brevicompactum TaxID=5074 RepID=UPI0025408BD1|nr:uncharacterized protein N7506_009156 [Penicillium brevicompactum]KAJ5326054.1 hypothetical protein N7506_009156 [Penicillium brevicompactum]